MGEAIQDGHGKKVDRRNKREDSAEAPGQEVDRRAPDEIVARQAEKAQVKITCLAPWYGSNRMLAAHVGKALDGCSWVGLPFCGGMSEVPHIKARTIVCNDRHRAILNLAAVVRDDRESL